MEQHQCSNTESNICPECLLILALCKECRENKEIFDEIFYKKFSDLLPEKKTKNQTNALLQESTVWAVEKALKNLGPVKKSCKVYSRKKIGKSISQENTDNNKKNRKKVKKSESKQIDANTKSKKKSEGPLLQQNSMSMQEQLQFYGIDSNTCDQIFSKK